MARKTNKMFETKITSLKKMKKKNFGNLKVGK